MPVLFWNWDGIVAIPVICGEPPCSSSNFHSLCEMGLHVVSAPLTLLVYIPQADSMSLRTILLWNIVHPQTHRSVFWYPLQHPQPHNPLQVCFHLFCQINMYGAIFMNGYCNVIQLHMQSKLIRGSL